MKKPTTPQNCLRRTQKRQIIPPATKETKKLMISLLENDETCSHSLLEIPIPATRRPSLNECEPTCDRNVHQIFFRSRPSTVMTRNEKAPGDQAVESGAGSILLLNQPG
jgi:hypothetical protein